MIKPFFLGPRQITASSRFGSMNPIDITARFSSTYTGDHPELLLCTSASASPHIVGTDGPQMSTSSSPTSFPRPASPNANCAANVLFPTPPLPLSTSIFRRTPRRRAATRVASASAPSRALAASPDAHAARLGHPAHDASRPARALAVPGHASGAFSGTSSAIVARGGATRARVRRTASRAAQHHSARKRVTPQKRARSVGRSSARRERRARDDG